MQRWLDKGYAVYSTPTAASTSPAGRPAPRRPTRLCANGYVHLLDPRYEVRDTQDFLGRLVDEGLIQPTRIAATGGSYGGGMSMASRAQGPGMLRTAPRPLEEPGRDAMSIAVATPNIPWTDLASSLPERQQPRLHRGRHLQRPVRVMKQSYVNGLYLGSRRSGLLRPAGTDPSADLAGWKAFSTPASRMTGGRPSDDEEITTPLLLLHRSQPGPGSAADQHRLHRRPVPGERSDPLLQPDPGPVPGHSISLFFGSFGTPAARTRSDQRPAHAREHVDRLLPGGTGYEAASEVVSYTQTCPNGDPVPARSRPPTGHPVPGRAPGQDPAAQTIAPTGGAPHSALFNPVGAGVTASQHRA